MKSFKILKHDNFIVEHIVQYLQLVKKILMYLKKMRQFIKLLTTTLATFNKIFTRVSKMVIVKKFQQLRV